jgi:VIT1/CCC1 family predicted Fe2+/Mn2+ transporter
MEEIHDKKPHSTNKRRMRAKLIFGYVKGCFTGACPLRSAIRTTLIGGLAAAAIFGLAKLISK